MLTRREALWLAPAASLLAAPVLGAATAKGRAPDFNDPHDNLRCLIRILGNDTGSVPTVNYIRGTWLGAVGDERLRPLFDYEGFNVSRQFPQADGSFRHVSREVGYFIDPASRAIVRDWLNPWTNERVEVLDIRNDPLNVHLREYFPRIKQGARDTDTSHVEGIPLRLPWIVLGDDVSVALDDHKRYANPLDPAIWRRESSGPFVRNSEFATMFTKMSELANPDLHSVSSLGTWNRIMDWFPWMLMGQTPGLMYIRSITKKLSGLADLPRSLLEHTERHYPKFLEAPREWSDENFSKYDLFLRERKPQPEKK